MILEDIFYFLIINEQDNAFMVAHKIRNYLQTNFILNSSAITEDPPVQGRDIVDWFCEYEEGSYYEFVSAFCVFARDFALPCRFINGFNSLNIEENFDVKECMNYIGIKYQDLFCWTEIYVPSDINGNGTWVQMDIFDDFN